MHLRLGWAVSCVDGFDGLGLVLACSANALAALALIVRVYRRVSAWYAALKAKAVVAFFLR